jgi:hypothetical protein
VSERYIVVSRRGRYRSKTKVHADRDCRTVGNAATIRPATDSERDYFDDCKACCGTEAEREQDWSHYRLARDGGGE